MILRLFCIATVLTTWVKSGQFEDRIIPFLDQYCLDCHDSEMMEGGFNMDGYQTLDDVLARREPWSNVYEKLESGQMPPPKRKNLPDTPERLEVLRWIETMAALPDPMLGTQDPGAPIIRRLNRLEYNNTVRDLLDLDVDIFTFSERLPIQKGYFDLQSNQLPDHVEVNVREYGSKAPVLLPFAGLPGENRAAHGYNNRGDAMNVTPLLLEKYIDLANQIVNEPTLPFRSPYFASLIGVDPSTLPKPTKLKTSVGVVASKPVGSASSYAPNNNITTSVEKLEVFRGELTKAKAKGNGGIFDVPEGLSNATVAGKGGLIRVQFGSGSEKQLTINPNADLWLVPFATAKETSGELLIANKDKGDKDYELTFEVKNGSAEERIVLLGCCVLARRNQTGVIQLTATLTDNSTLVREIQFNENDGNQFVSFRAPGRMGIKKLRVDGDDFSGDYVLLDDIGFVTNGKPQNSLPTVEVETKPEKEAFELQLLKGSPRERLEKFLARAFRRPPSESEIKRYDGLFQSLQSRGLEEAAAMTQVARAVLSSTGFLFQQDVKDDDAKSVRSLTSHELANRLSYFLWSSMPDEELRQLADNQQLQNPKVREEQVLRMLRDPKARELSESFAVQWLRMDQLYTAKPDSDLFPGFYKDIQGKNTLHASLMVEALLLFETIMLEDRSILELIDADFTWLNPRLVTHYGLQSEANPMLTAMANEDGIQITNQETRENLQPAKINDKQWFRVPLNSKNRGGIMTMGGPLTLTSLPFRTSPIKRGAWILETVFNRPPSEPKVAFAIEDDTKEGAQNLSIRERFEAHRNKPACYSCHIRLDPPGFALEHFDATGQWREKDGTRAVDASSEWNGKAFNGPAAFKKLIADNPNEFTRGFIEHLLSYALGRKLSIHDMPTVLKIQKECEKDGWRFSRLLIEISNSYPFTHIRNDH